MQKQTSERSKITPREPPTDLIPLNIIRQETVLSRYPIHRLSKKGSIDINIEEKNAAGEVIFRWKVEPKPPGPLAYKLDTLVINRRFDEIGRPLPDYVRLGSLRDIGKELGLGSNTGKVTKALRENSRTTIIVKLQYKDTVGNEKSFDFEDTRYGLIFTGQKFTTGPRAGEKANAVYLSLHPIYRDLLNSARVRPLDYDYLRDLSPAAQRFYELVSYSIYAALKYKHPQAKLLYSEYCLFSAQKRHLDYENFRIQMYKIHKPHLRSGYIQQKPIYESTTDRQGNFDWWMYYIPGPKAIAEYKAFNRKHLITEPTNGDTDSNGVGERPFAKPSTSRTRSLKKNEPSPALDLVQYFHQQARGTKNYQPQPGGKELTLAADVLADYGPEKCRFLVDHATEDARKTNYRMRNFAALNQYVSEALEIWDQRERDRAEREQREKDEAQRRRAEHAQDQQRVERLTTFKEHSPAVYQTIFDQEKAKFLKWLPWASKWEPEALEQAMAANLLKAIEQHAQPPSA